MFGWKPYKTSGFDAMTENMMWLVLKLAHINKDSQRTNQYVHFQGVPS